jgi:chromatin assembly factor 1 subunit A
VYAGTTNYLKLTQPIESKLLFFYE